MYLNYTSIGQQQINYKTLMTAQSKELFFLKTIKRRPVNAHLRANIFTYRAGHAPRTFDVESIKKAENTK